VEINTTLHFSAPQVTDSSIQWASSHLGVLGTWKGIAQPIKRTLLESPGGNIEWNCLLPRARAEVLIGGRQMGGLGYVEHLTMSIPPWQLPFDELRWGRFLSDEDALVWIYWSGSHYLNVGFHNGVPVENPVLTDHGFEGEGVGLTLGENSVLREGALIDSALSMIRGIHRLFPFRILTTHECKWISRGILKKPSAADSNGWAIHEVVRWPKMNGETNSRART